MLRGFASLITIFLVFLGGTTYGQEPSREPTPEQRKVIQAQRSMWIARILRQRNEPAAQIKDLKFDALNVPVFLIPQGESFRPLVKVKVSFVREGWKLYAGGNSPAKQAEKPGEFMIYAYLNSRISELTLQVRGPRGEVEQERVFIFSPEAQEFKVVTVLDSLLFHVGGANFVYSQTSFGTFSSITGLLGLSYLSPEKGSKFGLFGRGEMTVLTVSSTPLEQNPQFVDLTVSGTYSLNLFSYFKTRSRIFAGANMVGVISNGSPFGFSRLLGPDVGWRTDFYQDRLNSYSAELHLTPYQNISLSDQRGVRVDLSWHRNLSDLRKMTFSFQYSNISFISGEEEIDLEYFAFKLGFNI